MFPLADLKKYFFLYTKISPVLLKFECGFACELIRILDRDTDPPPPPPADE